MGCYTCFIVPEVYLVTLVYLVIIVYLVILVYLAYLVIMLMFTFSLFMPCYLYLFLCWKSLGLTQSLWLTQFVSPLFLSFPPPPRFAGWEYSLVRILPSSKALSCMAWISLGYGLLCFIGEYCSLFLCFFVFEQDRYFNYEIGYWKLMGFSCKHLYLINDLKYFHFIFRCFIYVCLVIFLFQYP